MANLNAAARWVGLPGALAGLARRALDLLSARAYEGPEAERMMHVLRKDTLAISAVACAFVAYAEAQLAHSVMGSWVGTLACSPVALSHFDFLPGSRLLDRPRATDSVLAAICLIVLASALPLLAEPQPGPTLRFMAGPGLGIWLCWCPYSTHALWLRASTIAMVVALISACAFGTAERLQRADVFACCPHLFIDGATYMVLRYQFRLRTREFLPLLSGRGGDGVAPQVFGAAPATEAELRAISRRVRRQATKTDIVNLYLVCRHCATLPHGHLHGVPGVVWERIAAFLCRPAARTWARVMEGSV